MPGNSIWRERLRPKAANCSDEIDETIGRKGVPFKNGKGVFAPSRRLPITYNHGATAQPRSTFGNIVQFDMARPFINQITLSPEAP